MNPAAARSSRVARLLAERGAEGFGGARLGRCVRAPVGGGGGVAGEGAVVRGCREPVRVAWRGGQPSTDLGTSTGYGAFLPLAS